MNDSQSGAIRTARRGFFDYVPVVGGVAEYLVNPKGPGVTDHLTDPLQTGEPVTYADVDAKTAATLRAANQAIVTARGFTPNGQGNQREAMLASRGFSTARMIRTRSTYDDASTAQRAAASGGANCAEYMHMTFADLAFRGATERPILQGSLNQTDHAFTLIGDPRETDEAIVVDAWVNQPQAHLWKDSKWNSEEHGGVYGVGAHNGAAGDPQYDLSGIVPEPMATREARRLLDRHVGGRLGDTIASRANRMIDESWVWDERFAGAAGPLGYCDPSGAVVRLFDDRD